MEIRQIQFFYTAAICRSYAKAAEKLFVSRQAISKTVHQLEHELGDVPLFQQEGKCLALTPAGLALWDKVLPVIYSHRELEQYAQHFKQNIHATLHIAIGPSVFWLIPPEVILRFADRYPGLHLILDETTDKDLKTGLERGTFDAAIAGLISPFSEDLSVIEFSRDPLYSVMSQEHPLAQCAAVDPIQLTQYPCIFPRSDSTLYELIMDALHKLGIHPNIALIARDITTVIHALKNSEMLAVNYLPSIEAFHKDGILVRPLNLGDFRCSTSLFFKKESWCRDVLCELGDYLKNDAEKKTHIS